MEELTLYLKRAADRCGFNREYYIEKNIPTHHSNVAVFLFHGDTRAEFILSSLLLKRLKDELKGSKYLILCGWPGHRGLFPYVDEYWSPSDPAAVSRLLRDADGFDNASETFSISQRLLNQHFDGVMTFDELRPYYQNGLTAAFHEKLGAVKCHLPMIPSSSILDHRFIQDVNARAGFKVLFMPTKIIKGWKLNRQVNIKVRKEFWSALLERLSSDGFAPVVLQGYSTYDLSQDHAGKGVFIREDDISKAMSAMRMTGCVLDVFNGTSRLALAARTPFVAVDERGRYSGQKEYEIDALCGESLPKQYVFSFTSQLEAGDINSNLFANIVVRLRSFLPTIDRDTLPSTSEGTFEVPYSVVRERKAKRIGVRFVKVPKD